MADDNDFTPWQLNIETTAHPFDGSGNGRQFIGREDANVPRNQPSDAMLAQKVCEDFGAVEAVTKALATSLKATKTKVAVEELSEDACTELRGLMGDNSKEFETAQEYGLDKATRFQSAAVAFLSSRESYLRWMDAAAMADALGCYPETATRAFALAVNYRQGMEGAFESMKEETSLPEVCLELRRLQILMSGDEESEED